MQSRRQELSRLGITLAVAVGIILMGTSDGILAKTDGCATTHPPVRDRNDWIIGCGTPG